MESIPWLPGRAPTRPAESGHGKGMTMSGTRKVTEDEASERERQLDEALDATFPASDPIAMSYPSTLPPEGADAAATTVRRNAA